jgi:hypothetical protein
VGYVLFFSPTSSYSQADFDFNQRFVYSTVLSVYGSRRNDRFSQESPEPIGSVQILEWLHVEG